jgi:hypothetical protein
MRFPNAVVKRMMLLFSILLVLYSSYQCNNVDKEEALDTGGKDSVTLLEPAHRYDLEKVHYMRLLQGKFLSPPTRKPYPSTDGNDVTHTFDSIIRTDNNIVIYFHGGMIPLKKAYRDPKKIHLHDSLRRGGAFPFYVLYGANPLELWQNRSSMLAGDEESDPEYYEEGVSELDAALKESYEYKSYVYLLLQLINQFDPPTPVPQPYTPIQDTVALLEKLRAAVLRSERSEPGFAPKTKALPELRSLASDIKSDTLFQKMAEADLMKSDGFSKLKGMQAVNALYPLDSIIYWINQRKLFGRDHGTAMTATEETICRSQGLIFKNIRTLARSGWANQKKDVLLPFSGEANTFGGTALLDELLRVTDSLQRLGKTKKIYLVGSSTGAIMLCNMLIKSAELKYRSLKYHVIFTVPSCSMNLFAEALDRNGNNINSVTIFSLRDTDDRGSSAWFMRSLYPGSILFLVSSVCENDNNTWHDLPLLGLQRFYLHHFYANNRTLTDTERNNLKKVMQRLAVNADGKSPHIAWSNDRQPNPMLQNTGSNHKGVIRNKDVQHSIVKILTHTRQ